MSILTEEQRICLAIWKKAFADPENFKLHLPTKSTAETVKRTLYRVIRPYREGKEYDPALSPAAQKLIPKISLNGVAGYVITFSGRETLQALQEQLESLGIRPEDIMSDEELKAQESLQRITSGAQANPFYSRED